MLIQDMVPVEQSKVWELLKAFYQQRGPGASGDGAIAQTATSNACMADAYAAIVADMLRDVSCGPDAPRPVILELGGGTGRFALQFLRRLLDHHWRDEDGPAEFSYLLTDATEAHVAHWRGQPRLQRLRDQGWLEFGQLALNETPEIAIGDRVLTAQQLRDRPLVIISNHVFDSIPTELYRIREGKLQRVLMSLESDDPAFAGGKPETFATLVPKFSAQDVAQADTGAPLLDAIVDRYVDLGQDIAIPVPRLAFQFLECFVDRLAPLLLLAGDHAYTNPARFPTQPPFVIQTYFAEYTNYHAFAELFRHHGGDAQFQRHPDPGFTAAAFWLPGRGAAPSLERLRAAARTQLREFAPLHAMEVLDLLEENIGAATFGQLFAWMRLARFDPRVAQICLPIFIEDFHRSDEGLDRQMLRDIYMEAYDLFLPDGSAVNFDYEIAQLLLVLRFDDEALALLESTLVEFGRTPERLYVYGLSLLRLKRRDEARKALEEALEQKPDFAAARQVFDEHYTDRQVQNTTELAHISVSCRDSDAAAKGQATLVEHGVVWFKDMFPRAYIDEVRRAFLARFNDWKHDEMGKPNSVGNKRYTVPLRMSAPFSDPALFANPTLIDMLEVHMGEQPIVNAYGGVITYPGANSQHIHREHPLLYTNDQYNAGLPAYAVNVLIPLVDLDEQLGGTQIWEGTHRLAGDERWQGPSKVVYARQGDAVVLDYRVYHGGMPCLAGEVRPVLFITYSLPWFRDTMAFDSHDAVAISASELAGMPESHRPFFRFARRIQDRPVVTAHVELVTS